LAESANSESDVPRDWSLPENLEGFLSFESEFDARAMQSYIDSQVAFVGMLTWWIENGMTSSPQQMTLWITRFALYGYHPSDRLSKQS